MIHASPKALTVLALLQTVGRSEPFTFTCRFWCIEPVKW